MTNWLTAVAALALLAASAHAALGSPAPLKGDAAIAAVLQRHAGYGQIGKAMRSAKKGLDGNDIPAVRIAAATINTLAPKAPSWFPSGTAAGEVTLPGGHKVEARPEIWQQPAQFAEAMKSLRVSAAAFNRAASGTDLTAMKAAHANLGGTCKSCHDRFRAE